MNLIAKLLPPSNIQVDLEASSKKRVFEQAGIMFENHQGIGRSTVFDSLFAREKPSSIPMSDPRTERLATVLVQYSAALRPGDRVLIEAETAAEPLVRALFERALQAGAHPHLALSLAGQDTYSGIDDAFLRLAAPVQFDAPDGKPVNLLFVLLVPEQATEQHLQILSELAQMFSDRPFREQLAAAADAAAIHALFTGWESHAAGERRAAV